MEIIGEEDASKRTKIHRLRLIGNSCADTDANRERVVQAQAISTLKTLLAEPELLPYAVAVLYNFMLDYGK